MRAPALTWYTHTHTLKIIIFKNLEESTFVSQCTYDVYVQECENEHLCAIECVIRRQVSDLTL